MNPADNLRVFCINSAGVSEGSQFLTLVNSYCSCRPFCTDNQFKKNKAIIRKGRVRTKSLPSNFQDGNNSPLKSFNFQTKSYNNYYNQSSQEKVELGRQTRSRSLTSDILRDQDEMENSNKNFEYVCSKCIHKVAKKDRNRAGVMGQIHKMRMRNSPAKKQAPQKIKGFALEPWASRNKTGLSSGIVFKVDAYLLSYFIASIRRSHLFRMTCIQHWSAIQRTQSLTKANFGLQNLLVVVAMIKSPRQEVLDLLGNKMVNSNILFRRSLEHALSWLSTLGGAFFALGDLSVAYAEEAGHVSITQLRIAMKLGDPGILSQCRLYAALSLLQRGCLKSCRDIVRREYSDAISLPEVTDPRLRRMCLGVWAKLSYQWKLAAAEKNTNKHGKTRISNVNLDGIEDIRNNSKYWSVYDLEENRKIASMPES